MAFIDLLINETALKFELGNKSIAVVSALISTMNNSEIGGVEGFLDRFRKAGLAATVHAWMNGAEQISLTSAEVETALEAPLLQSLVAKTGVNNPLLSEILAFLIPSIICHLSFNRVTLVMTPDEMRKTLWTVTNDSELADFRVPAKALEQMTTEPILKSFSPVSSVKSLSGKLLRSFPFMIF